MRRRPREVGYDAVEHLAKTVWPSKRWREVLMGFMWTAAFDASGHEIGLEHLVVAGILSRADHWINFDTDWTERLTEDNLPYLHMREFEHRKAPFDKLTDTQRESLLSDLYDIIAKHAFRKFVAVVINQVVQTHLDAKLKALYYLNSYVLAGRNAASMLGSWMQANARYQNSPLRLVFAKGDLGEGNLGKRLGEDGFLNVEFRYPVDKTIKGIFYPAFVPLQAADFLAYESYRSVTQPDDTRPGFDRFSKMQGEMGIVTEKDLKATQQWIKVNEEVTKWLLEHNIPLPKGTVLKKIKARRARRRKKR